MILAGTLLHSLKQAFHYNLSWPPIQDRTGEIVRTFHRGIPGSSGCP